jgi:hypothetical protein
MVKLWLLYQALTTFALRGGKEKDTEPCKVEIDQFAGFENFKVYVKAFQSSKNLPMEGFDCLVISAPFNLRYSLMASSM